MSGTNTGKGGFDIDVDGQTKNLNFDVGDPSAEGLDPTTPDHGDINVDNSVQDISQKTKRTLGQYVKGITAGNRYPNDGRYADYRTTTPEGVPQPISNEPGNVPQFVERTKTSGVVADVPDLLKQAGPEGHTIDQISDPLGTLQQLSKGKRLPAGITGNDLLPSVQKDSLPAVLSGYTNSVLANNRFSDSYRINGKNYNANHLKQVGVMLSLRGSQEFPAAFNDKVNPSNAGSVAGSYIPSPNQLGILKVPMKLLEARDALESLELTSDEPTEISISPIGNQSWGALNNVEEPWAGVLNIGMIAMGLAMQAALLLAFEGLGALIGLVAGSGTGPSPARKPNGQYVLGSYLSSAKVDPTAIPPDLMGLLGIHSTRFPFGDALSTGAAAFFLGAEHATESFGEQVADVVSAAAESALSDNSGVGFLIIVSRQIIRTGQAVAAQIDKIADAFSSNPMSGIQNIIGLLNVIKQSKLIAAINIFSTIGDAILAEDEFTKDPEAGISPEKGTSSTVNNLDDDTPGAAVKKSRLKGPEYQLKLAWASNRTPSLYLLPDSIMTMGMVDGKLGSFKGPAGVMDPGTKGYLAIQDASSRQQVGARIPRDSGAPDGLDVKRMEMILESEYVPFYFHDLRTNEIIAFHAFLSSLSDDYTASWETTDAYGRVDPIKIYKNTGRKVGFSFYIAALDQKDFDEMWVKINKLVTLVYPQYTKGRTLTDGANFSFVQPFSQLIGSSPVIRIRLGDLLRSNYSRFNLARLFGAADGDMKLSGNDIKFEGAAAIAKDPKARELIRTVVDKALADPASMFTLSSNGWEGAAETEGVGGSMGGPSTPDQAAQMNVQHDDLPYFKFKVKKQMSNGMYAMEPTLPEATDLVELFGLHPETAELTVKQLTLRYSNAKNPNSKIVGGELGYAVPKSALGLTRPTLLKIYGEISSGLAAAIPGIDELSKFLDIEKNALVKSFRSMQGKGLAGVIETMNFDWYDKVTWDTRQDHRAPKMCKVTIGFTPIHDISPGIDHLGYNRGPIYPVGGAMGNGFDPDQAGT